MFEVNEYCAKTENFFNTLNSCPFVVIPGSFGRAGFGIAQILGGLSVGITAGAAEIGSKVATTAKYLIGKKAEPTNPKWRNLSSEGFDHVKHGALNSGRAVVEGVVGLVDSFFFLACYPSIRNSVPPTLFKYANLPEKG